VRIRIPSGNVRVEAARRPRDSLHMLLGSGLVRYVEELLSLSCAPNWQHNLWAIKAQEVLILNEVPAEAIIGVVK
jgi:hypothetical protein